jgi:hypothetical protein
LDSPSSGMTEILARHLHPALDMIETVIGKCPDPLWNAKQGPAPVWLHLYHALVGIDFWFRSSKDQRFDFLTFAKAVDPDITKYSRDFLSKPELLSCLKRAREKAEAYVAAAADGGLSSKCPLTDVFTKADIILMQIRHLQHHVGFCNCALSSGGAQAAAWMGYGE